MQREFNVDMSAVARIASRVDLKDVCLTEVTATRQRSVVGEVLHPDLQHDYSARCPAKGCIEVDCKYQLSVTTGGKPAASFAIVYVLTYKLRSDEPVEPTDLQHFAWANGAFHSWPFVRELLHSMTGRMGFPPYTLPVLTFVPPKQAAVAAKAATSAK